LGSFRRGLKELGYTEGRDYVLEIRIADGSLTRLQDFARELVLLKPGIIFASSAVAALAARAVTAEIPIVSPFLGDGLNSGMIATQARPGGNVTGVLGPLDAGLVGKQLSLVREIIPGADKVGFIFNSRTPASEGNRKNATAAAASLSIELSVIDVQSPDEFGKAFVSLAAAGVRAVFVAADPMFFKERRRMAEAAQAVALPTVFSFREHVEAGGLASYGIDLVESYRRAASYVDKIVSGEKPAEIPAELPTKFELVFNLKTARAIGLAIPESFLVRADEVIE
jgi:putative ABC transport system substrate-binding protein